MSFFLEFISYVEKQGNVVSLCVVCNMQEAVAGVKSYKESVELQSEADAHTHIKSVQTIVAECFFRHTFTTIRRFCLAAYTDCEIRTGIKHHIGVLQTETHCSHQWHLKIHLIYVCVKIFGNVLCINICSYLFEVHTCAEAEASLNRHIHAKANTIGETWRCA